MQITVDNQDLNTIIELIDDEFNRLYRKENTTRAVALNDLRVRLEQQSTPTSVCCPVCQEVTCDWDCPNPQGRHQEDRPSAFYEHAAANTPSLYVTTDMMPENN